MKNKIPVSQKIIDYFTDLYGAEWAARYCAYAESEPAQFIRVNTLKAEAASLAEFLKTNYEITLTPVPGIAELYAAQDPNRVLGKTIAHITGQYYIQSLSSAMPVLALEPQPGERVLDLCAAPGSKTSFIAAKMQNTGVLVANEIAANRTGILNFNIERLSIANTGVMNMAGEWLSPRFAEYFDKILVDVPCSGLGIVHKKGEVSNWWNAEVIEKLAQQQYKLLYAALRMLQPGGCIVYSTCTLSLEENEMVLDKILKKMPVELVEFALPVHTQSGIIHHHEAELHESVAMSKRMIPWENQSEGFFVAKLRKTDSVVTNPSGFKRRNAPITLLGKEMNRKVREKVNEYFGIDPIAFEGLLLFEKSSDIYLASADWTGENLDDFNRIGIKIGTFDRYDTFIVHTNLIQYFGKWITKNLVQIESREDIKRYLEGGMIKGFEVSGSAQAAVAYQGMLLGSGVINKGQLKSRFPRSFRTQAIELI